MFNSVKKKLGKKRDIVDYIEMFYNSKRRHSYLENLSQRNLPDRPQRFTASSEADFPKIVVIGVGEDACFVLFDENV